MPGLSDALHSLSVLLPKKHIFLLSHMRAYTSLFGHIMGSNPSICGYYEMHIGYYSWRSLVRQKLLYARSEKPKPRFSFMFDKVLHDDHEVSPNILNRGDVHTIFSLRHPQRTIPSILKLYRDIYPTHEFTSEVVATDYYVQRLETLARIATALDRPFFYLDAETLVANPRESLDRLGHWLQLDTPLSPDYNVQKKTSRKRYGDTSGKLESGHILNGAPGPEWTPAEPETLNRAIAVYDRVRQALIAGSAHHCLRERPGATGRT